jgi:hypothetical protein
LKHVELAGFDEGLTYDACTPTNRVLLGGNVRTEELSTITFIPYADDARFDATEYTSEFEHLAWNDLKDPNGERTPFSIRGFT